MELHSTPGEGTRITLRLGTPFRHNQIGFISPEDAALLVHNETGEVRQEIDLDWLYAIQVFLIYNVRYNINHTLYF
ncbi:hypothetical protein WJ0W_005110 [Paenibacillus melissococcoides]|uniref:Uncharacterized protein n=1 Tax=Paenibacillus melissococcoides TaxID=2912268 RepID=A0ABM9G8Z8_9BACL|nr:hypothetical protein J6TS7_24690 [Paenibacillus dendritiformis]CAH8247855.1 hypothetical protein WJ0W_005110 [Paenibacillus melissococcoides]